MRVFKFSLFLLAVVAAVELTFRVYLYGGAAIYPMRMNSFNQIHHSGLVRAAANPDILFELKPDLDTWYKGTRFVTNAAGLRDQDYPIVKPDHTFRVVVLGSSWTMGSGVAIDDVWHSRMEAELNAANPQLQYEFINFGVDQYGIGEIIATLEQKALRYQPDLILVAVTYFTPTVLWPETQTPYTELPRRNPFFELHTLRVLDQRFKLGLYPPEDGQRPKVQGRENFNAQLLRAAARLARTTREHDIPMAIVKLAYMQPWNQSGPDETQASLADEPAFTYLDVTDAVTSAGYEPGQLSVSVWDSHPNALAHSLISDAVLGALKNHGLLPPPAAKDDGR